MKTCLFLLALGLIASSGLADEPYRLWQSLRGEIVYAQFIGAKGSTVFLRQTNGTTNHIDFYRLSANDQAFLTPPQPLKSLPPFKPSTPALSPSQPPTPNPVYKETQGQKNKRYKHERQTARADEMIGDQIESQYGEDSQQYRHRPTHVFTGPGGAVDSYADDPL